LEVREPGNRRAGGVDLAREAVQLGENRLDLLVGPFELVQEREDSLSVRHYEGTLTRRFLTQAIS